MELYKQKIKLKPSDKHLHHKNEPHELASLIHQAAFSPALSEDSLNQVCDASKYFKFSGLCTNLLHLKHVRERLGPSSSTKLIAVIAFPFGDIPNSFKLKEAEWAASQGADALDVVPNFYALHKGEINIFAEELAEMCQLNLPIKAILDLNNFSKEQLSLAIDASLDAGVCGIQSGNGFGNPISKHQIQRLALLVRNRCEIKAVGGIKTLSHANELVQAGANQLGTSYGLELMQNQKQQIKIDPR